MPLFPLFVDLSKKRVLVVGGGKVATRKVKNLLPFTGNITIVSPKLTEELRDIVKSRGLKYVKRRFRSSDLKDKDVVIVAVDDERLQRRVFRLCERRKILCNAVDSPEYCNFIFPALVRRGDVVIGITTSGRVPALSRALRERLEACVPEGIEDALRRLSRIRSARKKGKERQRLLLELARKALKDA
ncbi:MAG: bifunctional precorrin-2 dehydrogenase/sirohydrochlorin ferrochelatase [Aquificae bacterium]|nr:bifunctional precorrin-2 dehydrogenase/sirohydrochlorin ferrochelatase [Aquificota bacterium]